MQLLLIIGLTMIVEQAAPPVEKWSLVRIWDPEGLFSLDVVRAKPGYFVDAVVNHWEFSRVMAEGFRMDVLIEDLEGYSTEKMRGKQNFGNYYTFSEAMAILDSIHQRHPSITTPRFILPNDTDSTTWDGNHVYAMKISDNPGLDEPEPEVLYTGAHHAREPITVNIMVEWIRWLTDNYGTDPCATYIVNNREIWVIPVVNPDGYLHNESVAPGGGGMWRKNRRDMGGGIFGVDPNRNYPYKWGYDDGGSSPDSTHQTYRGPSPGSEPEVQSVMNLVKSREFVLAQNYHSFGNMLLYPFGYADIFTPDSLIYKSVARDMVVENDYVYGTPWEILYNANGTHDDWMYGDPSTGKIFAFTPEVGEWFWQEAEIENQIAETRWMNIYTAKAAGVYLVYKENHIVDSGGDGIAHPGDTVNLILSIKNISPKEIALGVTGRLSTQDPYIQFSSVTSDFGNIPEAAIKDNSFNPYSFYVESSCPQGRRVEFVSVLTTGTETWVDSFWLTIGDLRDTLFFDDFETGVAQWTWDSPWDLTTESSNSPTHSATDSPYGNYQNNRDVSLTMTADIDISSVANPILTFWHRHKIEEGWDYGRLEISTDGGNSWNSIRSWTGDLTSWAEQNFSLDSYGQVRFRFRLQTDGSITDDGWYIDDVSIRGNIITNYPPAAPVISSPAPGDSVTAPPTLIVTNATDPDGDSLTYGFRVFADSLLTDLVTGVDGIPEDSITTGWTVHQPLEAGKRYYWKAFAEDTLQRGLYSGLGWFVVKEVGIDEEIVVFPDISIIGQNPQRGSIVMRYIIPHPMELKIYDISGRLHHSVKHTSPGEYTLRWEGPGGIYFSVLTGGGFREMRKFILLK